MAVRLFEAIDHAAAYLQYRVSPEELISRMMNFVNKKVKKQKQLVDSTSQRPHLLPHMTSCSIFMLYDCQQ